MSFFVFFDKYNHTKLANPDPKKEGPTPPQEREGLTQEGPTATPKEGIANPNPKKGKGQPNRKGQLQTRKGRANLDPKGQPQTRHGRASTSRVIPTRRANTCLLVLHHQIHIWILLESTIITTESWPTQSPRQKDQPHPKGQPQQQERRANPNPKGRPQHEGPTPVFFFSSTLGKLSLYDCNCRL